MPTVRENLLALIKFVEEEPDNLFDLNWYVKTTPMCGTLHCTLGLAATKPYFQAQGLKMVFSSPVVFNIDGADTTGPERMDLLFGANSHKVLFAARNCGRHDSALLECEEECTDKELALFRLRHQLAKHPG